MLLIKKKQYFTTLLSIILQLKGFDDLQFLYKVTVTTAFKPAHRRVIGKDGPAVNNAQAHEDLRD